MIFTTIIAILIAFFTIFIPGMLFALALLRKTELNLFETSVIGFIFGMILPATLTWLEAYLINYINFFSFSLTLFLFNCILLTILGIILCYWQGVFKDFKQDFLTKIEGKREPHWWIWALLIVIMLSTFATRMFSIVTAPQYFEFDPYFDMIDTQYILTYGQQLLLDPSAWPVVAAGTNHRIEPLVPYIEAYWYDLSNSLGLHLSSLSTNLLSYTSSWYPPIAAALLVFVIFMLIYHEYDEYLALLAAGFTASMPILFITFIAGEQLVEPWGIFALFFFLAAYMLAVRNMKSTRLAVFAGIAFVSNFLGAHYYTVTTGVFIAYMLLEGVIDVIRGHMTKEFYRMNAIVIAVITIFFILYIPYSSTLQNRIPSVVGIPIVIAGPVIALLAVAFMDYVPKLLKERNIIFKEINFKSRLTWVVVVGILGLLLIAFTPLGAPIKGYLALSTKFTTPSSPLFMTVEEYIPTGLTYNFGAQGFGVIGESFFGLPLTIWLISALAVILLAISIIYRRSKTAVLYGAMAIPLMVAGFSEVKYMPHFGVAYMLLFVIALGELIFFTEHNFKFRIESFKQAEIEEHTGILHKGEFYEKNKTIIFLILSFGMFVLFPPLAIIFLAYLAFENKVPDKKTYVYAAIVIYLLVEVGAVIFNHSVTLGESSSVFSATSAFLTASSGGSNTCNLLVSQQNTLGETLYCNVIPEYWLASMQWIRLNVGPNAPRVLSWWDYGDWINWFGNSNAVLRGDNAVASEDYATAAHYVLDQSSGYGPQSLAAYMNGNQTRYVLFDQDLISKWQALDFLACININATSKAYAIAQGQGLSHPAPYELGTSPCEVQHDPQFALIPLPTLLPPNQSSALQQNINFYCSISNSTQQFVSTFLTIGGNLQNGTVCADLNANHNGIINVYNSTTGKKMNAVIQASYYTGVVNVQGIQYVQFLMIYLPDANGIVQNPPSKFYTSTFYDGFFLGKLPGFTASYPSNAPGVNFVNGTYPVRIFTMNNFTGQLPLVPPKPSYLHNNYTIP